MVDDRIFIKCKTCGGWKMLLKAFSGKITTRDNDILEWLNKHSVCREYQGDLGKDPGFTLHTEADCGSALDMEKQNYTPEDARE